MIYLKSFFGSIEQIVDKANVIMPEQREFQKFKFTRSKIIFTQKQKQSSYFFPLQTQKLICDNCTYHIDKKFDTNDVKRFYIIINNDESLQSILHLSLWNSFKCNLIHGRDLLYKEREYYLKTMISVLIGAAISYLVGTRSYKKGYLNAIENIKVYEAKNKQSIRINEK